MRHGFFGGVCPAPNKSMTRKKATTPLEEQPDRIYIPMRTSCEAPAEPIVSPGDRVLAGQPIARAVDNGVPVFSGVSGTVAEVRPHPHPWGGESLTVVIDNDKLDEPWPNAPAPLDPDKVDLQALLERVSLCGVVGMSGNLQPTAQKLRSCAGQVSILIVNAAESEPFVTADHRLLIEHSDQILHCARLISRCVGANRVALVTQGDKLNAVELLERRIRRHRAHTELITLRARYPLGSEKQLVQTVTGFEIPEGGTSRDGACLVLNLSTVYAIHLALFKGMAQTHREVTVTGNVTRPRNLWVPIGTPMSCLLAEAGGLRDGLSELMTSGVMRGRPVTEFEAPVVPDTDCLIALPEQLQHTDTQETACIRCGRCVSACPMHLSPIFIAKALRQNDRTRLVSLHPEDCISCGCCSFYCPANIPLADLVKKAGGLTEAEEVRS